MKIKLLLAMVLFLGVSFAQAQDKPDTNAEQKPPPRLTHFVKADRRVTKNLILLFDCSASMGKTNRFNTAIKQVNNILRLPLDDGMFSLLTFGARESDVEVWEGKRYEDDPKPPPPGWAKLPDAFATDSANKFLNGVECGGYTDLGSGIEKAFDLNTKREKVTLIIFTDGNNTWPGYRGKRPTEVVTAIKALQKKRTDRGKDKIMIFIFGVSAEQNVVMLSAIAKTNAGGYLTTDKVCSKCLKNKADKPEVQQVHRAYHISENHENHIYKLQGYESESNGGQEPSDNRDSNRRMPW